MPWWWQIPEVAAAIDSAWIALVGGVLVALVSGTVTYLVARRQSSGTISTTAAATLWEESSELRRELRNEVNQLRKENVALRKRIAVLERAIDLRGTE